MSESLGKNPEILKTVEVPKRKVFLEVGTGQNPVPINSGRKFKKDELYIGIEPSSKIFDAQKDTRGLGDNILFIKALGERLPLASQSVDELCICNVFTDPSFLNNSKKYKSSEAHEMHQIVSEFLRVLTARGKLIVVGTNTPDVFDSEKVTVLLTTHGFVIDKILHHTDEEWYEEIKQLNYFGYRYQFKGQLSYLVYAVKPKNK